MQCVKESYIFWHFVDEWNENVFPCWHEVKQQCVTAGLWVIMERDWSGIDWDLVLMEYLLWSDEMLVSSVPANNTFGWAPIELLRFSTVNPNWLPSFWSFCQRSRGYSCESFMGLVGGLIIMLLKSYQNQKWLQVNQLGLRESQLVHFHTFLISIWWIPKFLI